MSFSVEATIVSLMFWWIVLGNHQFYGKCMPWRDFYLSLVHMNRVPMLTPEQPRANAAASPWPSAIPPEAMNGILSSLAARAI